MERWKIESLVVLVVHTSLYAYVVDPFVGRVTGLRGDPFVPPYDRGEVLVQLLVLPRGWIFLAASAALVTWFMLARMPADEFTAAGNGSG